MGANLGARRETLRGAVQEISRFCVVRGVSCLYESAAVGPPQPDYLNAAVSVHSELSPTRLLERLLALEQAFGRVRRERWGARTLDLDMLWIEGTTLDVPSLKVPHPGLTERPFAILPLLDVVPQATDPMTGRAYSALVDELDCRAIRRVADAAWAE